MVSSCINMDGDSSVVPQSRILGLPKMVGERRRPQRSGTDKEPWSVVECKINLNHPLVDGDSEILEHPEEDGAAGHTSLSILLRTSPTILTTRRRFPLPRPTIKLMEGTSHHHQQTRIAHLPDHLIMRMLRHRARPLSSVLRPVRRQDTIAHRLAHRRRHMLQSIKEVTINPSLVDGARNAIWTLAFYNFCSTVYQFCSLS
jgi:hypothetical protein